MITEILHQRRRSITQMQRHGLIAGLAHQSQSVVNAAVSRIALRACGKIDHSLSKRNASFRPSYLHNGVKGGICQQKRIRIGKSDVLSRTYHYASGYELRILASLYHTSHPV